MQLHVFPAWEIVFSPLYCQGWNICDVILFSSSPSCTHSVFTVTVAKWVSVCKNWDGRVTDAIHVNAKVLTRTVPRRNLVKANWKPQLSFIRNAPECTQDVDIRRDQLLTIHRIDQMVVLAGIPCLCVIPLTLFAQVYTFIFNVMNGLKINPYKTLTTQSTMIFLICLRRGPLRLIETSS